MLLTETFSTGFSMTPGIGEPEGGPSAQFLAEQAAEHGVWVGGTCPEIAAGEDLPYNSFVLAGPGRHHAPLPQAAPVHPRRRARAVPGGGEAGDRARSAGLRVTPFVCYDLRFADVFWQAAPGDRRLPGAGELAEPAPAATGRRCCRPGRSRTRPTSSAATGSGTAGDGTEHVGDSRIVSPMGELLATAAGVETIVLADVDAAEVAATRDRLRFLPDRRGS